MAGCFAILAAVPGFFFSSLVVMLFWGTIAPSFGMQTVGYPMSMLITIALWLAVAPLAAAAGRRGRKR